MYAYTRHCYANVRLCLQTLSYVTRASSPSTTLSICTSHILQPPSVDNEHDVKLSYLLSLSLSLDIPLPAITFRTREIIQGRCTRGYFLLLGKHVFPVCSCVFDSLILERGRRRRRRRYVLTPLRKIYVQTSNGWRRKRERNRERESRIGYTRHRRVYRIRSGNVLGKWLRILAIDIFLREQKGARWNIKRSARLIANGNPPTHPHPPPPPAFTTTLRFMEHSVHSIFSIVDRPYLSYLCFF